MSADGEASSSAFSLYNITAACVHKNKRTTTRADIFSFPLLSFATGVCMNGGGMIGAGFSLLIGTALINPSLAKE